MGHEILSVGLGSSFRNRIHCFFLRYFTNSWVTGKKYSERFVIDYAGLLEKVIADIRGGVHEFKMIQLRIQNGG